MTHRPPSARLGSGPGVAPHTAPESSSRRYNASPVGSINGSSANGVSLFSRLFPDQVKADPELLTIVPNVGFARTLDHGSGVSRSASSTTTYSRPSRVKPPSPFSMTSGGTVTGADAGSGARR